MPRARILSIDDDHELLAVIKTGLEHYKFEVFTASDGLKGVEAAFKVKPDLILLDISMPKMSGYQVCQALKRSPVTAMIPIIFLTAKDGLKAKEFGIKIGAVQYVTKPFEMLELIEDIIRLVSTFSEYKGKEQSDPGRDTNFKVIKTDKIKWMD
jgi:DNA-binding response OmpR family regulator